MHADLRKCKIFLRMGLFCLILPLMFSCAGIMGHKNSEDGLLAAAESFNTSMRWEDYKKASEWIAPSLQDKFWTECDVLEGHVRFMECQVRNVSVQDGSSSGLAFIRYRFYYPDNPNVQTKTVRQRWAFSQDDKAWHLVAHGLQELLPGKP